MAPTSLETHRTLTLWCSLYGAYEALSPPMREFADRLEQNLHPGELFLCGAFVRGIDGMHPDDEFFRSRLADPNLHCRWRWREHDVAIWDERCTNHRGLSDQLIIGALPGSDKLQDRVFPLEFAGGRCLFHHMRQ